MKMRSFRYLIGEGIKNVWANRLMSLASIGVLVACMLITGVAVVLTVNIDKSLGDLEKQNVVMVYFGDEQNPTADGKKLTDDEAKALTNNKIAKLDNVAKAEFIGREEGLEGLLSDMGKEYDALFDYVSEENPLPNAARVQFEDLAKFNSTIKSIEKIEGVKNVRHQRELAEKITGIRKTVNAGSIGIVALLLIIAFVIVCNTIRITMYNRKLEISIMKAVGATDRFIRFPFMVEGITLGLLAAAFTTGLLYAVYRIAITFIEETLTGFTAIPFREFALPLFALFAAIGVIVGLFGSCIVISKYLRKEGSEFRAL